MRNEPLHAYSLHQRPLQEKRSIYYLFTQEYGILHGVAKKGIPQFAPLTLFATGKKPLKTLQQVAIADTVPSLQGQQQYAALYLNEITLKLLPIEDKAATLYQHYAEAIRQLQQPLTHEALKLVLRGYEQALFQELGYGIDLQQDATQRPIEPNRHYYFAADKGWYTQAAEVQQSREQNGQPLLATSPLSGADIIQMRLGIEPHSLTAWSLVHRQLIDHLFEQQPLQSRILWQQYQRYQ